MREEIYLRISRIHVGALVLHPSSREAGEGPGVRVINRMSKRGEITVKNRRFRIGVSLLVLAIGSIGLVLVYGPPATSSVQTTCEPPQCLQLPTITGANLAGQTRTFPAAFTQPYQLVVMPFNREQQSRVLDFVPLLQEVSANRADLGYYSLAALPNLSAPIRLLVSGGMNMAVTDPTVREAAYIFYVEDQAAVLQALNLPDAKTIRIYLLDQTGHVLWQASGDFTPELANAIRKAIAALPVKA